MTVTMWAANENNKAHHWHSELFEERPTWVPKGMMWATCGITERVNELTAYDHVPPEERRCKKCDKTVRAALRQIAEEGSIHLRRPGANSPGARVLGRRS